MNLKKRISSLEKRIKTRGVEERWGVVVARDSEREFQAKAKLYLANHTEPEKWIWIVEFSEADCINQNPQPEGN